MEAACRAEVLDLHAFFEAWFNGEPSDLGRLDTALAAEFRLVAPSGEIRTREALMAGIVGARGKRPGLSIWIKNFSAFEVGGVWLATYEEWQTEEARPSKRGRRSTAIFRPEPSAPHGVAWVHVHETWMI